MSLFLSMGWTEGSDSQGESLRKILYQYHLLKKVKFAESTSCHKFQICRLFPPNRKINKQADKFGFPGHSYPMDSDA